MHVEQSFGMLVARFGVLLKPLKFNINQVAQIVSACMRLHNFCIDNGAPPPRAAMTDDEQTVSDAALTR
jgi:Plant transposon protein